MKCPNCFALGTDSDTQCYHCGSRLEPSGAPGTSDSNAAVVRLCVLVPGAVMSGLMSYSSMSRKQVTAELVGLGVVISVGLILLGYAMIRIARFFSRQ